ncbi:MAG: Dabb family protein [Lentisphaeraceae bacterium]|nr:Dabb family protein [Lentisphaeraceae bacterium]
MFVHSVFFWLKESLTADQKATFATELQKLTDVQPAEQILIGTHAGTDRPVVVKDYDYALTCIFKNKADHDAYQVDPAHQAFIAACSSLWAKVTIYDAD